MSRDEKHTIEEQDLVEEMEHEIEEIEDEEGNIDEDKLEQAQSGGNSEVDKLKDLLSRTQADYVNYQNRVARDKDDMIFFLKSDILKKILPRVDDLQRMIQNTPQEMQNGALYEGIVSMESKLIADLDKM
ncbi:MAG: nucleotide exchange factor GrpE [Patescibacteria group bacterium]